MPEFTPSTPRGNYKFYDQAVTLPHVFAEGHTLTEAQARFLNQKIATDVGNRHGANVRKGLEALDADRTAAFKAGTYTGPLDETGKKPVPAKATVADLNWDHQHEIESVFTAFKPGESNRASGSSAVHDPIEAEVRRLAGVQVRAKYVEKGYKFKDMTVKGDDGLSPYDKHVAQYVELRGEQLREIVKAQQAALAAAKGEDEFELGGEAA